LSQQAEHVRPVTRREFLVAGALASGAILSGAIAYRTRDAAAAVDVSLQELVPAQLGDWKQSAKGDALIPTGEQLEDETYDEVLTRYYSDPAGNLIMFLMAYGSAQSGNIQLHRPEACYPAAGFRLLNEQGIDLPGDSTKIPSRALTARAPGRTEQILYWSRVGGSFPTGSASQRWAVLRQSLDGSPPDGVLVRMSALHPTLEGALPTLRSFAGALLASPVPQLRTALLGPPQ
jgi:EpsI family protein